MGSIINDYAIHTLPHFAGKVYHKMEV